MGVQRRWRIDIISDNGGGECAIKEIELRGTAGGPDLTGSGTASAYYNANAPTWGVDKAFDNNAGTYYTNWGGPALPGWIAYDFGAGNEVEINEIAVTAQTSGTAPKRMNVVYSDDNGATWKPWFLIPDQTGWANGEQRVFTRPTSALTAEALDADLTTQGTWRGTYGLDGYKIPNDATSIPAYVSAGPTINVGAGSWTDSSTDLRALERATPPGRQLGYYSISRRVTIDLTLTSAVNLALYCCDWDGAAARRQIVYILDGSTKAILAYAAITTEFTTNPVWLRFSLGVGQYQIMVEQTGPYTALFSGLFFGFTTNTPPGPPAFVSPAAASTIPGDQEIVWTKGEDPDVGDTVTTDGQYQINSGGYVPWFTGEAGTSRALPDIEDCALDVQLRASDGIVASGWVTRSFTVQNNVPPTAPAFVEAAGHVYEPGDAVVLTPATDPDVGQTLTHHGRYRVDGGPWNNIDYTGSPPAFTLPDPLAGSTLDFEAWANDGVENGPTASRSFVLHAHNVAPGTVTILSPAAGGLIRPDGTITWSAATDPDSYPAGLTYIGRYRLDGGAWVDFGPQAGLSFSLPGLDDGALDFEVWSYDGELSGPVASRSFVVAANWPPVPGFSWVLAGNEVSVVPTASDPDGDPLLDEYDWGDGSSDGLRHHWYAAAGTYTITQTVYDDHGHSATISHDVTVGADAIPTVKLSELALEVWTQQPAPITHIGQLVAQATITKKEPVAELSQVLAGVATQIKQPFAALTQILANVVYRYNPRPTPPAVSARECIDVVVAWTPSSDRLGRSITYTLRFSLDDGATWFPLASGLTGTSYVFDGGAYVGETMLIEVRAWNGERFSAPGYVTIDVTGGGLAEGEGISTFLGAGDDILHVFGGADDVAAPFEALLKPSALAPFGWGGEFLARALFLTLTYDMSARVRITPIVNGQRRDGQAIDIQLLPQTELHTERFEIPLWTPYVRDGVERITVGIRATFLTFEIKTIGYLSCGQLIFEGIDVEVEELRESQPAMTFVSEALVDHAEERALATSLGSGASILALDEAATQDNATAIETRARTNRIAPAGTGGDALFRTVYVIVSRANRTVVGSLEVTVRIDGEALAPVTVSLPLVGAGTLTEVHEIPLVQPGRAGQFQNGVRGCWLEVETRLPARPDGVVVIEGVEVEAEDLRESVKDVLSSGIGTRVQLPS